MMWIFKNLKTAALALGLIGVSHAALAQEMGQNQHPGWPVCNLETSDYVYWDALGENVVLHTKMTTADGDFPRATLTLEMADGERVKLGEGGKYFDDFAPNDVPSCDDHMGAAKDETLASLKLTSDDITFASLEDWTRYRTMGDIQANVRLAGQCDVESLTGHARQSCRQAQYMVDGLVRDERTMPESKFDRLVSLNAPVLEITYSTYGTETYVFDPETRTLTSLFYSGC